MSKVYLCLACGIGHTSGAEDKFCLQHEKDLSLEEKEEILHRYNTDEKVREKHAEWEAEEELRMQR